MKGGATKYQKMAASQDSPSQEPSSRLEELLANSARIEELSDFETENEYEDMGTATQEEQANIGYNQGQYIEEAPICR